MVLMLVVFILEKVKYRKAKFTHYPQFGINIPEGYSIHGIDVSKYQSLIAWEEVKAMRIRNINPGFAFIKATQKSSAAENVPEPISKMIGLSYIVLFSIG